MASHLADFIVTDNACMWRSSVSTWKEFQKPFCFVPAVNESSQPPAKRIKASTESYPSSNCKVDCLSFRVSCKCAGRLGRQISSQVRTSLCFYTVHDYYLYPSQLSFTGPSQGYWYSTGNTDVMGSRLEVTRSGSIDPACVYVIS